MLAAGIRLGNVSVSVFFRISAAIAACVISDEDVARLVTSSNDCFQSGLEEEGKHSWQGDSVQYNLVTTLTSISEPGGHSPDGESVVGSLLTDELSETSRARHVKRSDGTLTGRNKLTMQNHQDASLLTSMLLWPRSLQKRMSRFLRQLLPRSIWILTA